MLNVVIVIVVMLAAGALIGALASVIWKDERPMGLGGDLAIGMLTAVAVGLLDWFVVPAMGFSDTLKYVALATEPALAALLVLWLVRRARR